MTNPQPKVRSFIAIDLPKAMLEQLEQLMVKFRTSGKLPVRWLPVGNIHLTLKFLGEVESGQLMLLGGAMHQLAPSIEPFEITLGGVGAFPSIARPRVIWVGIEAPKVLMELANQLEVLGEQFVIPREERPFSPHLTIGRVQPNVSIDEKNSLKKFLTGVKVGELGRVAVADISLFRSDLRPSGAIYTLLTRSKLGKKHLQV